MKILLSDFWEICHFKAYGRWLYVQKIQRKSLDYTQRFVNNIRWPHRNSAVHHKDEAEKAVSQDLLDVLAIVKSMIPEIQSR